MKPFGHFGLFGLLAVEAGIITQQHLEEALHCQKTTRKNLKIGQNLVRLGYLKKPQIVEILVRQTGLELVNDEVLGSISQEIVDSLDGAVATLYRVVPVRQEGDYLVVATADPFSPVLKNLENLVGVEISLVLATPEAISSALSKHYGLTEMTSFDYFPVEEEKPSRPTVEEILASFAGLSSSETLKKLLLLVATLQVEVYDLRRALMRLDMDF